MNLTEHKKLLREYESSLLELQELLRAKEQRIDGWEITCLRNVDYSLPVPAEYVAKVLQERIWALESECKDRAQVLGSGA